MKIDANEAVKCLRSPLSNAEVMEKFNLTTRGFADLLTKLLMNRFLTENDLARRGIRFRMKQRQASANQARETEAIPNDAGDPFLDIAVLTEVLALKPLEEPTHGENDVSLDTGLGKDSRALSTTEIGSPDEDSLRLVAARDDQDAETSLNTAAITDLLVAARPVKAKSSKQKVTVYFAPSVAEEVKKRNWHPSQGIWDQEDGSVILVLEVPINQEIISWILGFGSVAEVVEPVSLRRVIRDELETTMERYLSDTERSKRYIQLSKTQRIATMARPNPKDFWNFDKK